MPIIAWRAQGPANSRLIRPVVVWLAFAWLPALAAAGDATSHPLLDLVRERAATHAGTSQGAPLISGVPEAEHALAQAHLPNESECAASLGAARYAELYSNLGAARSVDGDYRAAAAAFRSAHACRPRDAVYMSAVGSALFKARDFDGAREALNASLAIDPRMVEANREMGNLDFIAERWADAVARFRYVAASDADRTRASYGQLMLWLAQSRAGMAKPELVARTPAEGWPQPLLLYMRGQYTEAELVVPIKAGDKDFDAETHTTTDERLCEALYYVGEAYWAHGKPAVARDYFAALVNLKVLYYIEHGMALAEIAKLRQ